jgi:hypothetical protein
MEAGSSSAPSPNRRAITLQCGVFRETTIFEEQVLSVFQELVYFFLVNQVFMCVRVLCCLLANILLNCL